MRRFVRLVPSDSTARASVTRSVMRVPGARTARARAGWSNACLAAPIRTTMRLAHQIRRIACRVPMARNPNVSVRTPAISVSPFRVLWGISGPRCAHRAAAECIMREIPRCASRACGVGSLMQRSQLHAPECARRGGTAPPRAQRLLRCAPPARLGHSRTRSPRRRATGSARQGHTGLRPARRPPALPAARVRREHTAALLAHFRKVRRCWARARCMMEVQQHNSHYWSRRRVLALSGWGRFQQHRYAVPRRQRRACWCATRIVCAMQEPTMRRFVCLVPSDSTARASVTQYVMRVPGARTARARAGWSNACRAAPIRTTLCSARPMRPIACRAPEALRLSGSVRTPAISASRFRARRGASGPRCAPRAAPECMLRGALRRASRVRRVPSPM
jgi:hypothetical protein